MDEKELETAAENLTKEIQEFLTQTFAKVEKLPEAIVHFLARRTPDCTAMGLPWLKIASEDDLDTGEPVVLIITPSTVTPPGYPPISKELFWMLTRAIGHACESYATFVAFEAWYVTSDLSRAELPETLEDHPDRKEFVFLHVEKPTGPAAYAADIKTTEAGTKELETWKPALEGYNIHAAYSGAIYNPNADQKLN